MNLIQRVANSQSSPQRAEEARELLNAVPGHPNGQYTETPRKLLNSVPGQATIQIGNKNATIRVHAGDPSGGVDIEFEVPGELAMTISAADRE